MSLVHPHYVDKEFEGLANLGSIGRFPGWPSCRQFNIRFNKNRVPSVVALRYLYDWTVKQEPLTPRPIPLVLAMGDRKDDTIFRYYDTKPHFFVTKAELVTLPMPNGLPTQDVTSISLMGIDNQNACLMIDRLSRLSRHEEYVIDFLYSTVKPFNTFFSIQEYNEHYADKDLDSLELSVEQVFDDPSKVETVFLRVYNKFL